MGILSPGAMVAARPSETVLVWDRIDGRGGAAGLSLWPERNETMLVVSASLGSMSHLACVVCRGVVGYVYVAQVEGVA